MSTELKLKRILLAEDDLALSRTLVRILGAQFHLTALDTCEEIHEVLKSGQRFDCYLLDKNLKDGPVNSLIPLIRKSELLSPIIVFTGDSNLVHAKICLELGADDYVLKSENLIPELLVRIPAAISVRTKNFSKNVGIEQNPKEPILTFKEGDFSPLGYKKYLELAEKNYLIKALEKFQNDVSETAERLGIAKSTLFKKISELKIRDVQTTKT